jgi:hypothetical protein
MCHADLYSLVNLNILCSTHFLLCIWFPWPCHTGYRDLSLIGYEPGLAIKQIQFDQRSRRISNCPHFAQGSKTPSTIRKRNRTSSSKEENPELAEACSSYTIHKDSAEKTRLRATACHAIHYTKLVVHQITSSSYSIYKYKFTTRHLLKPQIQTQDGRRKERMEDPSTYPW